MLLPITSAAIFLTLAACVDAAKRLYLISSKQMRQSELKNYCDEKGGWPAVIDKQNLKEAIVKMEAAGINEVYVGKVLGSRKLKHPKIVLGSKKGSGKLLKSSGKSKKHFLCQTSEKYHRRKSRKAAAKSESSSNESESSDSKHTRRSRRPRGYSFKFPSGRTYQFANHH